MNKTVRSRAGGIVFAALLATVATTPFSAPAMAQAPEGVSEGFGDIVVTARRREESLQTVPIAVQAFDGDTLAQHNVQDASDLQRLVPALTTYAQARDEITVSIRGMSSSGATSQGQNPRVTTYFSQVPMQTGDTGPGHFFDLENVQVLKGPQGTLFGRNSTGGAVLYEPTRPKDELGGYVNMQFGRFHDAQIEGALNVPVTDTLAVRVAGKHATRDGFTKNLITGQRLDDRNYWSARGSVAWNPSEKFDTLLIFNYMKSDTNGSSATIYGYNPDHVYAADVSGGLVPGGLPLTLGGNGPSLADFSSDPATYFPIAMAAGRVAYYPDPLLSSEYAGQMANGPRVTYSGVDGVSRMRSLGITNISTYHVTDDILIRNIFGFRRYKQMSRYDYDGFSSVILDQITPDGLWSTNIRQISDELQVQGSALDGRLDFTVGAFVLWQKSIGEQRLVQATLGTPALTISEPVERSQSGFGQVSYEVIDDLKLTAGYRYTHDFRSTRAANYRNLPGIIPEPLPENCTYVNGCPNYVEQSFNSHSYNFGIDYQVAPTTLLYVAHRRGYRSGGLNPQAGDFGFAYGPETVIDFEVGAKTNFNFGGMNGRFNIAAFHSKLKGAQANQAFTVIDPEGINPPRIISLVANVGKARIQGIEADLMLEPFRGLNLTASYALTDGKYTKFTDIQTGLDEIRPFPFLAKHRLNLGGNYAIDLPDTLGTVSIGANWAYSSSYSLSVFTEKFGVEDGYNQLDLRAEWRDFSDADVAIAFFVNNVTNSLYRVGGVPVYDALGTTSALYSEPRTWGLQFRYGFGGR